MKVTGQDPAGDVMEVAARGDVEPSLITLSLWDGRFRMFAWLTRANATRLAYGLLREVDRNKKVGKT